MVEYYYWTGSIYNVNESLNRRITQFIRYNNEIKKGITNKLKKRYL